MKWLMKETPIFKTQIPSNLQIPIFKRQISFPAQGMTLCQALFLTEACLHLIVPACSFDRVTQGGDRDP
jgi:hypothetical protein